MIILNKLTLLLAFIIVIFSFNHCFAQKSKRLELEARRVQIQKEIKNINEMLFDNKKKKAMVFSRTLESLLVVWRPVPKLGLSFNIVANLKMLNF